MAITYPLTPPAAPKIRDVHIGVDFAVTVSQSPFTGLTQTQEFDRALWRGEFKLPKVKRRDGGQAWIAFLVALNGRAGTFLLGDPLAKTPLGVATGTPLVNGAHAARAKMLATDGWTPSTAGILKAGDFIQLGTGATTRLHMVLVDVASNGSGQATLDIRPALRTAIADNAAIVKTNTVGLWRLTENFNPWDYDRLLLYDIPIKCEEAL